MPHHSFVFYPAHDEIGHYTEAIHKVESDDKFREQVAVNIQRHGGQWVGEFSALTSRKLMEFITEVTMELPPEKEPDADAAQDLFHDGPVYPEDTEEEFDVEGSDSGENSDEGDGGTATYNEAADEATYEEHEATAGRPVKKLKKPGSVAKTSNAAITVEED